MARDDIHSLITPILGMGYKTNANLIGTAVNGDIIDLQGETGGVFLINVSGISAGSITPTIVAGDASDLSDGAVVTDDYLVETGGAISAVGLKKISYYGIKRYVRLVLTGSADLAGATAFAIYASAKQNLGALS